MMNENDCILLVRGLDIRFNLRGRVLHAIRGIDLDLYRGEVLAVVGESGSGKSVFTKSFMGLLDTNGSITGGTIDYYPTPGAEPVRLSGLKTEKDWLRIRGREIAMIMQEPMTRPGPEHWNTCGMWASLTRKCVLSSTPTSSPAACVSAW